MRYRWKFVLLGLGVVLGYGSAIGRAWSGHGWYDHGPHRHGCCHEPDHSWSQPEPAPKAPAKPPAPAPAPAT